MFQVQLIVTQRCNLKCNYCYIHQDSEDMSKEAIQAHLSFLPEILKNMQHTEFSVGYFGGEPLLFPETIVYTSRALKKSNLPCRQQFVQSNGLLLTSKLKSSLDKEGIGVGISFDGLWTDRNRLTSEGKSPRVKYEQPFMKKYISKYGCKCIVNPNSLSTLVDNYRYFLELGVLHPDFSLNRDPVWTLKDIKKAKVEFANLTQEIIRTFQEKKVLSIPGLYSLYILDTMLASVYGKRPFGCFAGISGLSFSGNGDLYPCARFKSNRKFKVGNSFERKLNKEVISFFRSVHNPVFYKECKDCPLYLICNVGCYYNQLEQGNWKRMSPVPEVCEILKVCYIEALNLHLTLKGQPEYDRYIKHRLNTIG